MVKKLFVHILFCFLGIISAYGKPFFKMDKDLVFVG